MNNPSRSAYLDKLQAVELSPEPEISEETAYDERTRWDKYRLSFRDFKKWRGGEFPKYAPLEDASKGSQLPPITPGLESFAFKYVDCQAIGRSVPVTTHPFVAYAKPNVSEALHFSFPTLTSHAAF